MIYDILESLKKFFSSRLFILGATITLMFAILIGRIFTLQIVKGAKYQEEFALQIQKTLTVNAARGNIYDCNGKLLAYNELAYAVTIYDNDVYESTASKNKALNAELATIINVIERYDCSIVNDFDIDYNEEKDSFEFNVSGTTLNRFRADVFGETSYDNLGYNKDFGFDESNATAEDIMNFLMHDKKSGFGLHLESDKSKDDAEDTNYYSREMAYKISVLRYAIKANRYTKYKSTTIAENVSDEIVAYMNEHAYELTGVEITEQTIRKYNYSEYFSSIIGYTGRISDEEYETYHVKDDSYTPNDTVGKTGLEYAYENDLRGDNGEKDVYVNNVGRITEVISNKDSKAGSDLYLSIDAKLQKATYKLLEQEIAGIVYSNIKEGNIAINKVFFALLNNNVVDLTHFNSEDASDTEKAVYSSFTSRRDSAIEKVKNQLYSDNPTCNNDMSEEMLDYITCIIKLLKSDGIIDTSAIDTSDETYTKWSDGKLSPKEYLSYCISQEWIDISNLDCDEKYADTSEIYNALCNYLFEELVDDKSFAKIVYEYMVNDGSVSGRQLCMILLEQGVLDYDDDTYNNLKNGKLSPSGFLLEKINNIEITPAQLALDPCTGSCIITDTETGQIRALVSYPGYDNNKLANGVDAEYYEKLNEDLSNPLYNYATQERTAPGSTFKMVTSTAGLSEGIISTSSQITCTGIFKEIDNTPKCWIYPSSHGSINVSEAIRDSCNVFYYTVGYKLSQKDTGKYNDEKGINYIQKYASLYGLDETTGLEINENKSSIADEYPVMAAIGQSNNNYTTSALSRYVTAITTGNLYTYTLMDKIVDSNGATVNQYSPKYEDISSVLSTGEWDAIHKGMKMVCDSLECFDSFDVQVAGKTGTAQQVKTRPNHALFVGYAPYSDPEVTITTRIAYGYTSHNAAAVSRNILEYYFKAKTLDELLSVKASGANASAETSSTD